jgi:cellulose synthase/poly-beta-1,6-N-acetylglucosamine synthase-like glycosyltransferase
MIHFIELSLIVLGLALLLPSVVFFVECFAALLPPPPEPLRAAASRCGTPEGVEHPKGWNTAPRAVVLVPANDEATMLKRTLASIVPELGPRDRLLVVADNCTDDTAEIAREAGADVLERRSPTHRGKGFALDAGIAHLAADPPDVVVVLDADCRVDPGSVRCLVDCATMHRGPVQAEDLLTVPDQATPLALVSTLAFMVRNHVRPMGLRRLGLPCHLMGTGMAFPWDVILAAPEAGSHLAEDMQMGIELTSLGFPPLFCQGARITSASPKRASATRGQRRRWEYGHLSTLIHRAPKLIGRGIVERKPNLLAMGLDLAVPPLALLVTLLFAGVTASLPLWLTGHSALPMALFSYAFGIVLLAVFGSWFKFGRTTFPARYLFMIPLYVAWKIPLYLSFPLRRHYTWERAERSASGF